MEDQLVEPRGVTDRKLVLVSNAAEAKTPGLRCGLPLGRPLVCGDPRHREMRAAESLVVSGGARSYDVWLIRSGILRLQSHSHDGRRQILSLFIPGEIVGIDGEFREGVTVETATQSGLCRIDRRWFGRMFDQNDTLRTELFHQKQDQLDRLHWLTWSLGALGPEERLCAFLALASRFMPYQPLADGTGVLSVQLPRRDIADLLGTTVESISRIVHKLADTGIIKIRNPAHFQLLDLPGLIARGKIEGHFDRLTIGRDRRRAELERLIAGGSGTAPCFCKR